MLLHVMQPYTHTALSRWKFVDTAASSRCFTTLALMPLRAHAANARSASVVLTQRDATADHICLDDNAGRGLKQLIM
jgi:hypothetical protein